MLKRILPRSTTDTFGCVCEWWCSSKNVIVVPRHSFKYGNARYRKDLPLSKQKGDVVYDSGDLVSEDLMAETSNHTLKPSAARFVKNRKVKNDQLESKGEIMFGVHPVRIALEQKKREVYSIYYKKGSEHDNRNIRDICRIARENGVITRSVDLGSLNSLAKDAQTHQGVCADVSDLQPLPYHSDISVDAVPGNKRTVLLVLAGVQDPMNFGAILRTAYYFGIDKVFITKKNSCRLSPVVSKASSGVLELLPIYSVSNLEEFLLQRRSEGWVIFGTSASSDTNSSEAPVQDVSQLDEDNNKIVMIIGNEGGGMPQEVYGYCSKFLTVNPADGIHRSVDSLNVSAATAVLLFGLLRRSCS